MGRMLGRLLWEERAQSMTEYALLAALVAVASIVILRTLGGTISNLFSNVNNQLSQ